MCTIGCVGLNSNICLKMSKIDLSTLKFSDFNVLYANGFISDADVEAAKEACGSDFQYDYWQLTIKDLSVILDGQIPDSIMNLWSDEDITCAEFFRRSSSFEQFIVQFCDIMDELTQKPTMDEKKASAGLPQFRKHEGFLVFAREYFGLKNFTEAENITLGDIYLAKKDSKIKVMFQRNISNQLIKNTNKK